MNAVLLPRALLLIAVGATADGPAPPFPYHLTDQYQTGECPDQLWKANRDLDLRESTNRKSKVVAHVKKDQTARETGNDYIVGDPIRATFARDVELPSGGRGRAGQVLYLLEEEKPGRWLAWLEGEVVEIDQTALAPGAKLRTPGGSGSS
jgi:hypothetical protein